MTKPIKRIHNTETGEVIDREMTNAEYAKYEKDNELQATERAEAQQAKKAAEAKLATLGLNADDLKALGL